MRNPRPFVALIVVSLISLTVFSFHSFRAQAGSVLDDPPIAVDDSYTLHASNTAFFLSVLANDSDPEGGVIFVAAIVSPAQHGIAEVGGLAVKYTPTLGYTGGDNFSYRVCDLQDNCSTASVQISLVNSAPVAIDDAFTVRVVSYINFIANDSDADGDPLRIEGLTPTQHGLLRQTASPKIFQYLPVPLDFVGTDSFVYQACDDGGACSSATVTLYIVGDGENDGAMSCNARVGEPVNVTNGNMYVQQVDYALPGVGPALTVARSYNSNSQRVGLFGKGWTTDYELSINSYDNNLARLNQSDGRAVYFGRPMGSATFLSPLTKDFRGALGQNGSSGFTLTLKDGSARQFDAAGKLVSLLDRSGNQTTLAYDGSGKLASVTDTFGRVLLLTTNSNGQVIKVADSQGTIATYTYGGSGQLLSVTYADNSAFQFGYDGSLRLTTVADALGNIVESHTYDSSGRALTSEKHGGVEHYWLSYLSTTQTDVTDALGRVTKYTFETRNGRNVVTNTEGVCSCGGSQMQSWTYDDQLNITSHSNALGQTATYIYDADGNKISANAALGSSTFTYNEFGQALTATDAMGAVTTYSYNATGSLISVKDALNNLATFTYDARGELLTMTNALGKTTSLGYDAMGNISDVTDALGSVTRFTSDARGRLLTATDALTFVTSYAYDPAGRVNKITRPDQSFITFSYDLAGRRTKTTNALNNATTFAFDSANRLISETDALGKSIGLTYDLMSNLIAITDRLGRVTNVQYDDFNRPTRTTYPSAIAGATRLQESVSYDSAGNVTQRTDPAGRVTSFAYDDANRLNTVTDPLLQGSTYEYDARSNVIAFTDALGQRYSFIYDALSRLTAATRAGMTMSFAYDGVGNRVQRTDYNNMSTSYTYDALNRLTKITYPDANSVNYAFDKLSQLKSATNINGTLSFSYDSVGRTISTGDVFGQVLNYTYDANDRRMRLSFGATTNATYVYDALDRPTKITDSANDATTYVFDAASRLVSRSLPNGFGAAYSYDGLDRLTKLKEAKKNTVIVDNNYQYNASGNVTQNIDQGGTHAYSYDTLDRLTAATYAGAPAESYAYDAAGNRTTSQLSATYGYQPFNRLMSTSNAGYLYDNNGNLISKTENGTTQFVWDFENRLTQVVTPAAGSVSYKYDALGRRIQRAPSSGVSTNYVYDGADVVKDLNSDGSSVEYLNGPGIDNKIRQKGSSNNTTFYFSSDNLRSTAALTDARGKLVERLSYDSYGNSAGSIRTRYGFTGRERDQLTGLLHYRARSYDPQVGRFISEDPIGLAGGTNQFAYVGNNPQNGTDPSGLFNEDVHYYLTYFLATKFSCLSTHEARLIADADQSTDENPDTEPWPGLTSRQRDANSNNHGFNEGNDANLSNLRSAAMSGGMNFVAAGRYLHYLQDTYSHRGFNNSWYGQYGSNGYDVPFFGGFVVDNTNHDLAKSEEMARATFFAIYDFAKKKGCHCRFDSLNNWWPTVSAFLRADNDDLEKKRLILNVPLR